MERLRGERGWSQRELAARAGVSHGYVALLEAGKLRSPGKFKLDALARALGVESSDALVADRATSGTNVVGRVEQLRAPEARLLPVYRWGSCGDPRDRESAPDPDYLDYAPLGREHLIGPHGFGVLVKGESMARRAIHDGDVVWVNPDRPIRVGGVVLARATDEQGHDMGMVVKTYGRTEVGACLLSDAEDGRSPFVCREFSVIGPVVWVTSGHPPS